MYTMQKSSYLGRMVLVSIWFKMVLIKTMIRIYVDSLILKSIKYQCLTGITLLIPHKHVLNLIPLLMLIINTSIHLYIGQTLVYSN